MSEVQCPNCGHRFEPPSVAEQAVACYRATVVRGMSGLAYARRMRMSGGNVVLLRRLGHAIEVVGVAPDSALFKQLSTHALATRRPIGQAIENPAATPASVQEAVDRLVKSMNGGATQ